MIHDAAADQRSAVEEAWAKFAVQFRERALPADVADAARRFLELLNGLGQERLQEQQFSGADMERLGGFGMFTAAVVLAERSVETIRACEVLRVIRELTGAPPC